MMPSAERYGTLTAGIARNHNLGNHEEANRLRTELRKEKLKHKIREAVDAAPPLSAEQLAELRALLSPGAREAA